MAARERTFQRRRLGVLSVGAAVVLAFVIGLDGLVAGAPAPTATGELGAESVPPTSVLGESVAPPATTTTTPTPPTTAAPPPSTAPPATTTTTAAAPPATTAPAPLLPPVGSQALAVPGHEAPVLTRVETTDPVVFLTIDDGVTRSPEALAEFRRLGIPASLFLVDGPIQAGADWFRRLPGTLVESHSRTHPDFRTLPESAQRDQICGNADVIEETFGRRPVLFRPPYGSYDQATQRAAAACGMRALVLWQETVNNDSVAFREVPYFRPGDIILMHFRPSFVQELNVVKQRVDAAGLRFALLEDYLVPDTVPSG
jgi:peptidoglycan/xylan/chitin deacetylase (PgdA/CDA1 family)